MARARRDCNVGPVSGRPRKFSHITAQRLKRIVLAPATKFGFETDLWTVGRLHAVLVERLNMDISEDTVWRRLREAGLTWQTPERQYFQADPETRRRWQAETIPKIRETLEKTGGILYCEDEASVCLTPLLGKTWVERGKPRKVPVTGARASIAAMSALSPKGRLAFRLHNKRITSVEVIDFLTVVAAASATPCCRGNGSSQAAYVQDDQGIHRKQNTFARVLFAALLTGLES